ncbi:MAG: TrmO family methyltransferase [Anaerolineales bacterium]
MLLVVCYFLKVNPSPVQADGPVVRAILFYSPACSNCHVVINEHLLPLLDEYGDQLEIIGAGTSRSPRRLSPIGVTIVDLISVERNVLRVHGLDAINRPPVLDLKPV